MIVWNNKMSCYEYDDSSDDGKNNDRDFKLCLLNELAELNGECRQMSRSLNALLDRD